MLYSSGAINGTSGSDSFETPPWSLSQPFTIASPSIVTDLSNIGIWVVAGDTFTSLDWTISTSADGGGTVESSAADVGPSTSMQLTPASSYGNSGAYDVYNMSFSVPDVSLAAGTYYLTLSNGIVNCGGCSGSATSPYWDINGSGSGVAYFDGNSDITNRSWSFEVDGHAPTTSAVPEPSYTMLLGVGLAALVVLKKFRPNQA